MIANLTKKYQADNYLRAASSRIQSHNNDLQAFRSIIKDNPQWKASLFDEHFFRTKVVAMVEAARKNGSMVKSSQITSAWADQLHLDAASREVLKEELAPIADQLLADLG
jgi:hypothetical protein